MLALTWQAIYFIITVQQGFISGEFSRDIEIDKVVPGLQERRIKGGLCLIMCY